MDMPMRASIFLARWADAQTRPVTLAISEGWSEKGPSEIQRVAPFTVRPATMTRARRPIVPRHHRKAPFLMTW